MTPFNNGNNNYVIMPTPYWLLKLLKGPLVAYATLDKAVWENGDWGLYSNVQIYMKLKYHHINKKLQIDLF
jgi:hypothetical protein